MRIAFIGQKGIPAHSGGVEHHVEEIATRMAEMGHEVTVYARARYTRARMPLYKGVRIVYLPSIRAKHLEAISHTFLATLHALAARYDVVNYQSIGPASLCWIIRALSYKTAVVATFHCKDYEHAKWGWFARWYLYASEIITCRLPHEVIVTSRTLQAYVRQRYRRHASYIPSGVTVAPDPASDIIAQWGLRPKQYILAVSRLVPHKNIHLLIEAFIQLDNHRLLPPGFKLVITGDGAYTDEYIRRLHNLTGGRPNIICTGGQYGRALAQLFSHAYCFVQPSCAEGLSLALLEAMGYGLMPVASDIPGNREAAAEAGIFVTPGSSAAIAAGLIYALNSPEKASALGRRAMLRVHTHFQWDDAVRRTLQRYMKHAIPLAHTPAVPVSSAP